MNNDKKKKIISEILDWIKTIVIALAVGFVASKVLITSAQVPTRSMEDTVMAGSRLLINRVAYAVLEPKRGDIVAFYYPDDEETVYLKRIIALPGETVEGDRDLPFWRLCDIVPFSGEELSDLGMAAISL